MFDNMFFARRMLCRITCDWMFQLLLYCECDWMSIFVYPLLFQVWMYQDVLNVTWYVHIMPCKCVQVCPTAGSLQSAHGYVSGSLCIYRWCLWSEGICLDLSKIDYDMDVYWIILECDVIVWDLAVVYFVFVCTAIMSDTNCFWMQNLI